MQARRLAKRPSLGGRRGGSAPSHEAAALGLPPAGPGPAAGTAPGSWRPPLPPPRGTGPPRSAAAAPSPVLLLLGEEDEDEEGAGRRRRARGRVAEKPRGGAEEEEEDDDEDEEVVVEVVDGDDDEEDGEERFVPLAPGRAFPKGPARGAVKVGSFKREMTFTFQSEDLKRDSSKKMSHHLFPLAMEEDVKTADTKKANRIFDHEKENTRSICLLEQKRKVVSSNIDVPPVRRGPMCLGWLGTHYIAKNDLELLFLLHSPPEGEDYSCVTTCSAYALLGIHPRAFVQARYQSSSIQPCVLVL